MAIYQIKIKGKEGIDSYETFRAESIEDTIKEFSGSQKRLKESLGDKYQTEEIEHVKLLSGDDSYINEMNSNLEQVFRDLRCLGDIGISAVLDDRDWMELSALLDSVQTKVKEAYSLIRFYFDAAENKKCFEVEATDIG